MNRLWTTILIFILLFGFKGIVLADADCDSHSWPSADDQLTDSDWGVEEETTVTEIDSTTVVPYNTSTEYSSTVSEDYYSGTTQQETSNQNFRLSKSYTGKGTFYGTPISHEQQADILNWIEEYANKYDLPVKVVKKLAHRESRYRPDARSGAGAKGVMQVIPKWHRGEMAELGMTDDDIWSAEKNIELACLILRNNLNETGSIKGALRLYGQGYR